jgi:hypothetical protein
MEQDSVKDSKTNHTEENNTTQDKQTQETNTNSEIKTFNDYLNNLFFSFDKTVSEFAKKPMVEILHQDLTKMASNLNENTNQNIDILKTDLTKIGNQVYNFVNKNNDMVKLNASEMRKKVVEELYQKAKQFIVLSRHSCKSEFEIENTSKSVLEEVTGLLLGEGFDVTYDVGETLTKITIEW